MIGKAARIHGIHFLALLALGCSAAVDAIDRQSDEVSPDLAIIYHEESARMDVVVTLDQFNQRIHGTVQMRLDVKRPDGTLDRHDLDWKQGDGPLISRIELMAADTGVYDVVLTKLSIDDRPIEGLPIYRSMEIIGARSEQELVGECGPGQLIEGTPNPDYLVGGEGDDAMFGYDKNDAMYGEACGDVIRGGKGNDDLWGGKGNDHLLGGNGNDTCRGGPGWDTFHGCEHAFQNNP